jgi:hypothetical protein
VPDGSGEHHPNSMDVGGLVHSSLLCLAVVETNTSEGGSRGSDLRPYETDACHAWLDDEVLGTRAKTARCQRVPGPDVRTETEIPMNALDWPWGYRKATDPLPAYLQQIRITVPVQFDPTLQTAGETIHARQGAGPADRRHQHAA